jgi:hypothetical protein
MRVVNRSLMTLSVKYDGWNWRARYIRGENQVVVWANFSTLSKAVSFKRNIMEQRFFAFLLIIEGTTEKVLQLIMPLKSIYSRKFGFVE